MYLIVSRPVVSMVMRSITLIGATGYTSTRASLTVGGSQPAVADITVFMSTSGRWISLPLSSWPTFDSINSSPRLLISALPSAPFTGCFICSTGVVISMWRSRPPFRAFSASSRVMRSALRSVTSASMAFRASSLAVVSPSRHLTFEKSRSSPASSYIWLITLPFAASFSVTSFKFIR